MNAITTDQDQMITISPNVTYAELEDTAVVLNVENGQYYGLNEVAAVIYQLIEAQPRSVSEIATCLLEQFDVEEDVLRADLDNLLLQMRSYGIIASANSGNA